MELLETSGISKSFDSREVIRDISVRLSEGEIVSLLGLSGSGKITLLNIISGQRHSRRVNDSVLR